MRLDANIDRLIEERERLRVRAEKVTQTISDMPKGSDGDGRNEAIIKMIDLGEKLTAEIAEYYNVGESVRNAIDSLEKEEHKLLLRYRYIDGYTFEQIAVMMNYSWRQIHRLHSEALNLVNVS